MELHEWLGKENTLGMDIWNNKYRYNEESFDEWLDRVSSGNDDLKQLIRERKFLFGGRTLANRNTGKKGSFSNCYSRGFVEDDLTDIMNASLDIAKTFKAQGGQGISLSKLRPKGCGINNGQFASDGIIPFMEIYNRTTESISQGGSRKGALIMTLDAWHKEAEDFIKIKSEDGRIQKANLSLEIDDEFMECVSHYYKTGEKITKHIVRNYNGNVVEYDVVPIDLYKLMMEKAYDWAEPGCIYTNRFRNYNMMEFVDEYQIETCNPCFAGDMKLLTVNGYRTFEELEGQTVQIYNADGNVSNSKVWCSGEKDTVKVILANGEEIICTPDHRFMTIDNMECLAKDLAGKYIMPINKINNATHDETFIKLGFLQGDGELSALSYEHPSNYIVVNIGEKDTDIRDLFTNDKYEIPNNSKGYRTIHLYNYNDIVRSYKFSLKPLPEREFPETYDDWTYIQKASFLCGCYSSNGSVISSGNRIAYKTTCKNFADKLVQTLEKDFGISAYITTNKSKDIEFENGTYTCKESYDVNIASLASRLLFLSEIGFYQYYKKEMLSANLKSKGARVFRVEPYKKLKVYDFSEPYIHWGIVNGYVVHNCGEQPLPKHGACNLGSINLSEFVVNPFENNSYFNFESFKKAVWIAVEALDTVLDENMNNHALTEQREMAYDYRNVGLGIMGAHDALIKLGITYGSKESKSIIDKIMNNMFRESVFASNHLARKKGSFPKWSDKVLDSNIIKLHFSDEEINKLKECGLRNCSLLSIAPSGSIGTMLNISTGCEPLFMISYKRKTESLNGGQETYYDVYSGIANEYISRYNTTHLPEYFNTSANINWKDRIDIQSVLQFHVDTAISSTVNLPRESTLEEIEQLYLYAWKKGLKGVTIFRDGCARLGILTTDKPEETEVEELKNTNKELPRGYIIKTDDNCVGLKRTLQTGCGTLHCEAFFDPINGQLLETYFSKGSSGGCNSFMIGLSRMISLAARGGVDIYSIVDQLSSCVSCPSYAVRTATKRDTSKGSCCPGAIGNALLDMYNTMQKEIEADEYEENEVANCNVDKKETIQNKRKVSNPCPQCGEELVAEGGCFTCKSCSYSKCE